MSGEVQKHHHQNAVEYTEQLPYTSFIFQMDVDKT